MGLVLNNMREDAQKKIAEFIGKEISRFRERQDLRQEDMAKQVGLSRTSISNIERGEHVPTLWVLYRICQTLGVEVREVLPRQDVVFPVKKNRDDPTTPLLNLALQAAKRKLNTGKDENAHEE